MSKADRERSARERLADERRRAAGAQRRRRLLVVVLGAVAAVAVVVVIVVVVVGRDGGGGSKVDDYTGPIAPATRQQDGSVAMANSGVTAPVLDVFEDFQCPACKAMEARIGGTMKKLAAEGRVKVVYRPFQLFQQDPLMSNSRRAANAAACMPADHWVKYHDKLYAEQPPEGDKGFSNADLVKWAARLGVTAPSFTGCVNGGQKLGQVDQATAYAGKAGVTATPYLALNGGQLGNDALSSPDGLQKAVAKAGSGTPRSAGRRPSQG
ncbi:DsbA family protein [Actinomadura napierensis]|uniref:Thioredoxin-like fold domain-containing protein n=1 Tax=Actinomadura napierensis TaxID=267854 RepID=A0ABN3ABF0_9ACTN